MNTTFPSSPEKIYNLMFTSGFIKEFMVKDQHLTGGLAVVLLSGIL